jgi:hypothetical protein
VTPTDEDWEAEDWKTTTHTVVYRPEFRIKVHVPPWVTDVDEWLGQAATGWNDDLTDPGERWTEGAADVGIVEIANEGSAQYVEART